MLLLKEGGRTDGTRYRTDVIHYQANKNSWRFKRVGALLCSYCAPPPPPPWSVERSPDRCSMVLQVAKKRWEANLIFWISAGLLFFGGGWGSCHVISGISWCVLLEAFGVNPKTWVRKTGWINFFSLSLFTMTICARQTSQFYLSFSLFFFQFNLNHNM